MKYIQIPEGYPPVDFAITYKDPAGDGEVTYALRAQQGLLRYESRDRKFLEDITEPYPSDKDIIRWGKETRKSLSVKGYSLSKEGLQYWARYFFDPSQERDRWEYVCGRIEALF